MQLPKLLYRVGVDVGGKNTDSALACDTYDGSPGGQHLQVKVIKSSKTPTTSDITGGICIAIENVLSNPSICSSDVLSINIGTANFINAIIQAGQSKLARVAVLRLCGPFCREVSSFADFPPHLCEAIEGPVGCLIVGLDSKLLHIEPLKKKP
ncbi:hypothetical protein B0J14DRAFT_673096 [Halenospora varia]|nr:hypothetical protein B0J14DRAFT_673096 [Halenospora varia]